METLKSYLVIPTIPKIRLPSLAQLKDGSFLCKQTENVETADTWLHEFEAKIVSAQEVAVWSNPCRSVLWILITQYLLYSFCSSSTPLLSTTAYLTLSAYLYYSWVWTIWPAIRVPPNVEQDSEQWTPVNPDTLSAPELNVVARKAGYKVQQILSGLKLLRSEQPGKFCIAMSVVFLLLALLGTKISTPVLLHSTALITLVLPAIIVRLIKNEKFAPIIKFLGDFFSSIIELLVYRGANAPPRENKDLDEFVPETTEETVSVLNKALSYVQKQEKEDDLSLIGNMSIPSHEEIENESLNALMNFEQDLLPTSTLAIENSADHESSDSEVESPSGIIRDYNDSDTDSLDLEPEVTLPKVSLVTSSVTSVTNTVTSVTNLLGSFLKKNESEPDLDDFEMISEDELSAESP